MKQILTLITAILLSVSLAAAVDLSDFPAPFVKGGDLNAILVVGDSAKASDIIGVTDIAVRLQYDLRRPMEDGCQEPIRIDVGAAQLASAIIPNERDQNLIVVGGPCANQVAASLLDYPEDCAEGFGYGKALIKLFEHNTSKFALLVAGMTGSDTLLATTILADYQDYPDLLKGTSIEVTETTSLTPLVVPVS